MSSANPVIQVRVNQEIKQAAMRVADGIGIPLSTLINAFVTRLAWEGRVPFELAAPKYNAETLAAFAEADAIAAGMIESEPVDIDELFRGIAAL